MTFRQIVTALGGPTRVSRILGLRSNRYVRKVIADALPVPAWWMDKLIEHHNAVADALGEFEDES